MAFVIAITMLLLVAGCRGDGSHRVSDADEGDVVTWTPASATTVRGIPAAALQEAIASRLADRPEETDEDTWRHVRSIYAGFGGAALWMSKDGLVKERVASLADALAAADSDAIAVGDYPIASVSRVIAALRDARSPTAAQIAEADVQLTALYTTLGEDMLIGQVNPRSVSQSWYIDTREENIDSTLARAMRDPELDRAVARMRPRDPGYDALRRELGTWRDRAANGRWPTIPKGPSVAPRDTASAGRLAAVAERLRGERLYDGGTPRPMVIAPVPGDSIAPGASVPRAQRTSTEPVAIYDDALAGAVAAFQARHGIVVDSVLGPETVESLNQPAAFRLGQIAANLERFRWLPRTLGDRYIIVNVPAFQLQAYDKGKPVLEMKVVVGAEYDGRATPVFSDSMQYVVFRPYWNVPDSIAAHEIYPKAAADPSYMASHNYIVTTLNGKQLVRQKPGGENSLGLVKFIFPNDYAIYLHDTPEDALFAKDVRAYSHGCIRVEHPDELAQFVLGWSADSVQAQLHGRDDHRVNLPSKIPVYIVYFTTFVRDGELLFGNDLYARDAELVERMGAAASGDRVKDALAGLRG